MNSSNKSIEAIIFDKKYTIKFDSSVSNKASLLENIDKLDHRIKSLSLKYEGTSSEKLIVLHTLNLMEKNDRLDKKLDLLSDEIKNQQNELEKQQKISQSQQDTINDKDLELKSCYKANKSLEQENDQNQTSLKQTKIQYEKLNANYLAQTNFIKQQSKIIANQNSTINTLKEQALNLTNKLKNIEGRISKLVSKLDN